MRSKNIDYYMRLSYVAQILQKNDRYYLYIPELHLIAEGDDLNSANQDLEREKRELFEKYFDLGRARSIPLPTDMDHRRHLTSVMQVFALKTIIVTVVAVIILVGLRASMDSALRELKQNIRSSYQDSIDRLVNLQLTPEREAEYHEKIRAIVKKLKPYATDLAPLFGCQQQAARPDR